MLHLISQTPLNIAVIERIGSGDDVVFLEIAVWNICLGHVMNAPLQQLMDKACQLHVLQDELEMNGISPDKIMTEVLIIDYSGLVDLSVKNKVIKTWC